MKIQRCQTSEKESNNLLQRNPGDSTHPVNAKLPKLQIKKFTGDPKEWQSFWDSFSSAVHTNKALKNVDKLNYLKSLLEGAALSAITGLALTEPNYANAVDILKGRFGNKQLIISSHMEAFLKLKPVTALSDIKGMRAALDKVEIQVRALQALAIESDQYGGLLIPIFMAKLPDELRLIVSREHKDDWKLDSVLQAVKSEVEARERCNIRPSTERPPVKKRYSTGSALLSRNQEEFNCLFCKGAHRASDCRVVTNVDQRKDILKKQGRCFICLRRGGHMARNCDSKIQCFGCQGRHHLAVCDGGKSRVIGNSAMEAACNLPEMSTPAMHVSSGMQVFLQTAQVVVSMPGMGSAHSLKVRAIFDTGAQRSYVSQGVVDSLKLETWRLSRQRP